ncbi:unnamed protein product [Rotaria sp. Silwood1]|nr:unnamed protein product [Rotaria sp. Silwood1]CAF1615187.1 unnamed protein product [Rotaria sp. Silwood1]
MHTRHQGTMTEFTSDYILNCGEDNHHTARHYRRICGGLTIKDCFQLFGSFLLPLLLTIFTVVITFEQRNESKIQRLEDRISAREQREQDLNVSILQRETDKAIAEERRIADNLNAERQRNMSLEQRQHELIIEQQRYDKQQQQRVEDAKLLAEQRFQDLQLAEEKRIADNLNAKEQRDNDRLIAERKQLADDLNAEKERNISREIEEYRYEQAKNKDLDTMLLSHINDMGTLLENYNGSLTTNSTIAALARAKTLHVIRSIGPERSARLLQFLFDAGQLTSAQQKPLDLSGAILNHIDLSASNDIISMRNVTFVGVHMNGATFAGQDLSNWNFTRASLNSANFTRTNCKGTIFDDSSMVLTDFSHALMDGASFRRSQLADSSFVNSSGERCIFDSATLRNSTFYQAKMSFSNFHNVDLTKANLEEAYLSGSTLAFATLVDTQMNGIYVLFANLSYANMSGAICLKDKCYLQDALSLLNAILPNGTNGTHYYKPRSLLQNAYATCNAEEHKNDHLAGWWMLGDPISTNTYYHKENLCVFTPKKGGNSQDTGMAQSVNITMYNRLITNGHAAVSLKAHRGQFTAIEMNEIDGTGKVSPILPSKRLTSAPEITIWEKHLQRTTVQIEVKLMFQVSRTWPYAWFQYAELSIHLWFP